MPTIVLETRIKALAEICFDLIRDKRLHAGKKTAFAEIKGNFGLGQTVAFNSVQFGIKQRLVVKVVQFERPLLFVDEMTEGVFKSFKHIHEFSSDENGVLMRDTLIWTAPFGILGEVANKLFLENHLRKLVAERNLKLKEIAESSLLQNQWRN